MIGIVAMSLLVSDLDHPYHGFLCVRLHHVRVAAHPVFGGPCRAKMIELAKIATRTALSNHAHSTRATQNTRTGFVRAKYPSDLLE